MDGQWVPLYEDNHLLILNKPAGLLTQSAEDGRNSLEQEAKVWIKNKYQKPGNVFLEAIHRLDKPASGIVVFGKTSKALSRLNLAMRNKRMHKIYWCWVEGEVLNAGGQLEHFLVHDNFHATVVGLNDPSGKKARLSYHVLQKTNGRTLLEVNLDTGRYHQIRIQMATMGHPILGDQKYGSQQNYEPDSIALHHCCLKLPHPISHEILVIKAFPSPAFVNLGLNIEEFL